ncbi:MAG: hypothetical protein ACLSA6_03745 [Holdemania massiliensis]
MIYFVLEMMRAHQLDPQGKRAIVSGSGNVAIYAAEKALQNGIQVIAMSDSRGYIVDDQLDLNVVKKIKEQLRTSLSAYPEMAGHGEYHEGSVYDAGLKAELALPCATQNEINKERAGRLLDQGCLLVAEGANMPNNNEAIALYHEKGILFAPGKASNAGGVATSALEMSQNSMRLAWTFEEVDDKLRGIMRSIHEQCQAAMNQYLLDPKDYVTAANIAGVQKVIDGMIAMGDY